ncbi:4-hydroxy-tetrahydrodipicolinate synthase [Salipaludibacillus sp. HK11]|uniref:4-hydroxy-tetrahydrodipicolinate synthase n=1 Tax=Salipaludibacillus sp. HK11 TaxID=3394320 RepID=UPI0039FDAA43
MNFGHILTAMVTPFDQDGNIDFPATKELIQHLLANGSDGIVVAGTTGESPTLSIQEKVSLYEFTVEVVDGRGPVIAGTGTNSTRAAIELTELATRAGVDGVMLATPYYNKPSQEGMYAHFKAIAAATPLPVMLYNVPGRSSVTLLPATVIRLSEIKNIVSIKEASGDLDAMSEIIDKTSDDFTLYSGDDSLTLPILSIGGNGAVSVSSHIIGNEMKDMITAHENGHVKYAAQLHRQLLPVMDVMFSAPSPSPVKAALEMCSIKVGSVRLPLVSLTPEESQKVHHIIRHKIFSSAV